MPTSRQNLRSRSVDARLEWPLTSIGIAAARRAALASERCDGGRYRPPVSPSVRLAVGLVVLAAIAVAALTLAGVHRRRAVLTASGRAVVQLTVVALALRGVFAAPGFVVLALAVMFGVATWTAARRLRGFDGAGRAVVLACGLGAAVTVGL